MKDLPKELDTPYLNSHPDIKQQLANQLMNMSSSAFSLQQLVFDLDNAALQAVPTFEGIPRGSNADIILQKAFVSIYSASAKSHGLPLIAVTAVAQSYDRSQLHLTGYERQVSQLKDEQGVVIQNPTSLQRSATTLDYLCAVNGNTLPSAASFGWNWVLPTDINSISGVIAINRNTIGKFILDQLRPLVEDSCIKPSCHVSAFALGEVDYTCSLSVPNTPQTAVINAEGPTVVHIQYHVEEKASDKSGLTYGELQVKSTYTCDVSFQDETITIVQHLLIYVYAAFDYTTEGINAFDKTITNEYKISVDQYGTLRTEKIKETPVDKSQSPDRSWLVNIFTGINDVVNDMKKFTTKFGGTQLEEIPFNHLQNFIFPGAKVFTYNSAKFSDHQDLICDLTYVSESRTLPAARVVQTPSPELLALNIGSTLSLTYSSDLLQNYVQGEIVSPTGKFRALQTIDGHGLLFSIDSSGLFHAIEERSGQSTTGWQHHDLLTTALKTSLPGDENAMVRTFDVGQNAMDGTIGLAMAVFSGSTDHLYVSVNNSSSDTSWIAQPNWMLIPFDAVAERPPTIAITGILFAETASSKQYLIVDIDRSTNYSGKDISRYYIDLRKSDGVFWVKHDVPIDIEDGNYQSCIRMVKGDFVDGIYTSERPQEASSWSTRLSSMPSVRALRSHGGLPFQPRHSLRPLQLLETSIDPHLCLRRLTCTLSAVPLFTVTLRTHS